MSEKLEEARGELRQAAIDYAGLMEMDYEESNYIDAVIRLEVAAENFVAAKNSTIKLTDPRRQRSLSGKERMNKPETLSAERGADSGAAPCSAWDKINAVMADAAKLEELTKLRMERPGETRETALQWAVEQYRRHAAPNADVSDRRDNPKR